MLRRPCPQQPYLEDEGFHQLDLKMDDQAKDAVLLDKVGRLPRGGRCRHTQRN